MKTKNADALASEIPCVLDCDSIAARAQKARWRIDSSQHTDFHQYIWLTRGSGRCKIDGVVHGFAPNTAIFIPAMTVHSLEFTPGCVGWTVSVRAVPEIATPETAVVSPIPRPTEQTHMTGAFAAINSEFTAPSIERADALLYLAGLLTIRFRRLGTNLLRSDHSRNKARRRVMQAFIERLEERFSSGESVKDYADALDITTTHLTRVCRETTGRPATRLIRDRTILEAKRKLTEPDVRINAVSEQLGFRAPSYFTRVFTEETGKSPREYRNAMQTKKLTNPLGKHNI